MSRPDIEDIEDVAVQEGKRMRNDLSQAFLSGLALTIPFFITILVLMWISDFVSGMLTPLVDALAAGGLVSEDGGLVAEALAAVSVLGLVMVVGLAAKHGPNTSLSDRIDVLMEDIPGIGSIYTGVERMSEVMIESDTESFKEVKIVEFPREGAFAIAFLTGDTLNAIEDVAGGQDLLTVFVPMAPNPVMGGHVLSIPKENVYDVDMTVEQGMEAILTTGLALDTEAELEEAA